MLHIAYGPQFEYADKTVRAFNEHCPIDHTGRYLFRTGANMRGGNHVRMID